MNKILRFLVTVMLLCIPFAAKSQYFEEGGIAYNILSAADSTVEVVPRANCIDYSGNINIPSTVTHNDTTYRVVALGEQAFYTASLTNITIPTTVEQIKEQCFMYAHCPMTINIPASVTNIERLAFVALGLKNINVDEDNPNYRTIDGMLFSKDTSSIVACPMSKKGTIVLPQNTKHIVEGAFYYCEEISSVTLPDGLSSIGEKAFYACREMNNISIPSSVTYIGSNPFGSCKKLNNLSISEDNTHYYMDGMLIYTAGGDSLLSAHKSGDTLYLPNTLRYVNGFFFNSDIRYVNVPDGVTKIGEEAFRGSSLVGIDMPSHLDNIDGWAFANCESLAHVGMPTTLDTMGESIFESCSKITSIDIPNGLRTIPSMAFYYCDKLSNVNWGNSVTEIGLCAFAGCKLTSIQLPETLRNIRAGAFIGYSSGRLKRVVFSSPIDTIEPEVFSSQRLNTLYLKNTVPPVTVTMPEFGEDYGCLYKAKVDSIFVPCGSIGEYLADSYWGRFAGKYYEDCNAIDDVSGEDAEQIMITTQDRRITIRGTHDAAVAVYDALGRQIRSIANASDEETIDLPSAGIYIVKVGDNHTSKIVSIR